MLQGLMNKRAITMIQEKKRSELRYNLVRNEPIGRVAHLQSDVLVIGIAGIIFLSIIEKRDLLVLN
jgi:hypothetical protein